MGDRWLGVKMMAAALIAIIIVGRLVLHIGGIVLVLLALFLALCLVFWAGAWSLIRR